jgi:hypothetical protein
VDALERLATSGLIKRWVKERRGTWDHAGWLAFLATATAQFGPLPADHVGLLLEEEKRCYRERIDRARTNRKVIAYYVDILSKVATIVAIVVGGIWAYRNFNLERTDIANPQVVVDPRVLTYTNEKVLLVVNITLKNVGRRIVRVSKEGCLVSVELVPADQPLYKRLKFGEGRAVVKDVNILDEYYVGQPWNYEIEPGNEYHEIYSAVMPKGQFAHVRVSLPLPKDDALTEYRLIHLEPR